MKDFYKGKKVLITGHTGFKGSWLTKILSIFGAEIVGVSLQPETDPNLFTILRLESEIKHYICDIRDAVELKKIFNVEKPEIVFHLAAQAIVRDSYDDPLKTYSTNVDGTANVLQIIKEVGGVKSAVIITTDKVYENKEWCYPYRECDPLGGHDPYSASKAAADIVAQSYIKSFFNPADFGTKQNTLVSIARAGNVIGGGDWAPHRLVPDIVRSVYEKREEIVIRSPHAIRPWEHVMEPLSGYLLLGQKMYEGRSDLVGAWNFGPNNESFVEVGKLVKEAITVLNQGSVAVQPDITKHEANILKLDISKAQTMLGWEPQLNFKQNLELTFDWYKMYYEKSADAIEFTNTQINNFFK